VVKCSDPFTNLPKMERIVKEMTAFLAVKDNGIQRAPVAEDDRAR
jgi:hypothetical protein